jgi:hypothetical protein
MYTAFLVQDGFCYMNFVTTTTTTTTIIIIVIIITTLCRVQ